MSGHKSDCRKFQPNIFNKSKCTNCFRQKEEHSAEALECNRASRKVCRCGYLFVAPDWDFSDPANRTKRWQRRWFVLYDDGELTYSLDEHPDTVPQAVVDMTRILEVSPAENVTGHQYSLALAGSDRVTFIKATSREEQRWWLDALQTYPNALKGRHKRNATFPCGKPATTILPQPSHPPHSPDLSSLSYRANRPRHHSVQVSDWGSPSWGKQEDDVFTASSPTSPPETPAAEEKPESESREENKENIPGPRWKGSSRTKEALKSGRRYAKTGSPSPSYLILSDVPRTRRVDSLTDQASPFLSRQRHHSDKEKGAETGSCLVEEPQVTSSPINNTSTPTRSLSYLQAIDTKHLMMEDIQSQTETDGNSSQSNTEKRRTEPQETTTHQPAVRGDPDGCGREPESSPDVPPDDLHVKKGWLTRQTLTKDWYRYWFVLKGAALLYYRDPSSEERGFMDGVIDLSLVKQIDEKDDLRNYAFKIVTWSDQAYFLAAATPGIRSNWVHALRTAANIKDSAADRALDKELASVKSSYRSSFRSSVRPETPRSQALSSDEEYRTASETSEGRPMDENDYLDWTDECPASPRLALPPSPPLTRTPMSRVKERARSRSSSRTRLPKRSRSSPPSSRRTTRDRFPASEDREERCHSDREIIRTRSLLEQEDGGDKDTSGDSSSTRVPSVVGEPHNLVEVLESEVETLRNQLQQAQVEMEELCRSNPDLRKAGDTNPSTPEASDSENGSDALERLKLSLKEARDVIRQQQRQTDDLKAQLHLANADLDTAERELDKARQDTNYYNNNASDLQAKLQALTKSLEQTQVELLSKEDQLEDLVHLQRRYKDLAQECEELQEKLEQAAEAEQEWNQRYDDLSTRYVSETEEWRKRCQQAETVSEKLERQLQGTQELLSAHEVSEIQEELDSVRVLCGERKQRIIQQEEEILVLRQSLSSTQTELNQVSQRLQQGIEENESLSSKLRELERSGGSLPRRSSSSSLSSSRRTLPRIDSLSDLTSIDYQLDLQRLDKDRVIDEYTDLLSRFDKAILEIRCLKRELRQAQSTYDSLELHTFQLNQELKSKQGDHEAQMKLMSSRIQDLSSKLSQSEKQVRILKQKAARGPEKRRTSSLKGKDLMTADLENKVVELEGKLESMERLVTGQTSSEATPASESPPVKNATTRSRRSRSQDTSTSPKHLRRRSLESSDGVKLAVKLNNLETRMNAIGMQIQEGVAVESHSQKRSRSPVIAVVEDGDCALGCVLSQLNECLSEVDSGECKCSCGLTWSKLRSGLSSAKQTLLSGKASSPPPHTSSNSIHKILKVLINKVSEVHEKRRKLLEEGKLDHDEKLKLTAERLAYQAVLIGQLVQAVKSDPSEFGKRYTFRQLAHSHRKLLQLQKKLESEDFEPESPHSSLDFSCRVLVDKLLLVGKLCSRSNSKPASSGAPAVGDEEVNKLRTVLLEKQAKINEQYAKYKKDMLSKIAYKLAKDTIEAGATEGMTEAPTEQAQIRAAWNAAQDMVSKELVKAEMNHTLSSTAHLYEREVDVESDLWGALMMNGDRWQQATDTLREQMEDATNELSGFYDQIMETLRNGEPADQEDCQDVQKCLSQFADVVAHKAVVDAELAILTNRKETELVEDLKILKIEEQQDQEHALPQLLLVEGNLELVEGGDAVQNAMDQAEFHYLFSKLSRECQAQTSQHSVGKELQLLRSRGQELKEWNLRKTNGNSSERRRSRRASDLGFQSSCKQCDELRQRIAQLQERQKDRPTPNRRSRSRDDQEIKHQHQAEINKLQKEYEFKFAEFNQASMEEKAELEHQVSELQGRLACAEDDYTSSINALRESYQLALQSHDSTTDVNTRERYQGEIQQLKALWEKSLARMESSQRRTIAELEEKHRREMEESRLEKEQALREETQATLAALDAMRKAHQADVQREVSKFKDEFLRKMQPSQELDKMHKAHEEEMDGIKREIISLSERYSAKCLETVNLEEEVQGLSNQLTNTQNRLSDLESRHRQLRQHLNSQASMNRSASTGDVTQQLRLRETELLEKKEEISTLRQQLSSAKTRQDEMRGLCRQLHGIISLGGEVRTQSLATLHERMDSLLPSENYQRGGVPSEGSRNAEANATQPKELMRSPSCPRLGGASNFLQSAVSSPLTGMVASRKKVFEKSK